MFREGVVNNMTAPIIQANYERLEQVAARFAHAAATQERLIRTVRRQADMPHRRQLGRARRGSLRAGTGRRGAARHEAPG